MHLNTIKVVFLLRFFLKKLCYVILKEQTFLEITSKILKEQTPM